METIKEAYTNVCIYLQKMRNYGRMDVKRNAKKYEKISIFAGKNILF